MNCGMRFSNILFIDSGAGYGGSSMYLYYLLKYLDREKFNPFVAFYFFNNGSETKRIKSLGIPVFFLNDQPEPSRYIPVLWLLGKSKVRILHEIKVILRFFIRMAMIELQQIWRLHRLIRKKAIDLVVLNNDVHYHIAGALGAKLSGTPVICRKAGGIGEGRKIKKFLTPCVDLFIAISKATAEDQLNNNPLTRRLVTIYEGVDLGRFNSQACNPKIKGELGIPDSKKVVGNISRFDKGKGQSEFLEAAALIIKSYSEVVFLMVGDGELTDSLKTKAKYLNLENYVKFLGWRKNIDEILSILDIFVHCPTSWIEGLGIANLEAMAMGKPCVVSKNGGLPEAVLDGVTGFVVPIGDIRELANAILKLLINQDLAIKLGKNARSRIENEFDIRKNTIKIAKLLEQYVINR